MIVFSSLRGSPISAARSASGSLSLRGCRGRSLSLVLPLGFLSGKSVDPVSLTLPIFILAALLGSAGAGAP